MNIKRISYFIAINTIVVIYIFFTQIYELYSQTKVVVNPRKQNDCNLEWERLNQHNYLRSSLAFYYKDANIIRLYLESNNKFDYKFKLTVTTYSINNSINYYVLTNVNKISLNSIGKYEFGYLESELNIENPQKVTVSISADKYETKNPLKLKIQNLNTINDNKNHSIVCSCAYSFETSDHFKMIKWWIEMNLIQGYDKIVMFNNSISQSFTKLFSKYKNKVQIIQFKCLPNFFEQEGDYFTTFTQMKSKYGTNFYTHFQFFTLNECYLRNYDRYQYISVNDPDETVIPRNIIKTNFNETNLKSYLKNLNLSKRNNKLSFYFKMGVYMKQETMDSVFKQIKILFKDLNENSTFNYIIDVKSQSFKFKLSIDDKNDYLYAKELYEIYSNLTYNASNGMSSSYNRLFYLLGEKSTSYFAGKTIYNTNRQSNIVSIHSPILKHDLMWVPMDYGHSSHFRNSYNLRPKTYPIKELFFDKTYYNYYFKPLFNKFSS